MRRACNKESHFFKLQIFTLTIVMNTQTYFVFNLKKKKEKKKKVTPQQLNQTINHISVMSNIVLSGLVI